jgi:hypothetical protein
MPRSLRRSGTPEQAEADNAIHYDHDSGKDRIACQCGFLRRSGNHDGDDQRHLDHGHGNSQDQRAERLARAMGHDLGVVYGGEHSGDEDGSGYSSHQAAHPDEEDRQQDDPGHDGPCPCPPRHPFRCHADTHASLCPLSS